jgi:chromate transporter
VARSSKEAPKLVPFLVYFLKLGTFGFGGPIALAEHMERDLVEERGWIDKQDYVQGLALSQLAPGPLAAQLAMYLGFAHSGVLGATLVGLAFILPSFLMVVAIAAAYSRYGGLPWVQSVFYGIGAAVMAIIVRSAYKLADRTVGRRPLLWLLFGLMALVTAVTGREMPGLFVLCGIISLVAYSPRGWLKRFTAVAAPPIGLLAPYGGAPASLGTLATILGFFTKGPVVITSGFIGYLVAGLAGACAAAFGVFFPVYLFVVLLTPWYRKHGKEPHLAAFVDGVTAAAVGALCGAALILGRGAIRDVPTAAIALVSLFCLLRLKLPEPAIVGAAGLAGLLLK